MRLLVACREKLLSHLLYAFFRHKERHEGFRETEKGRERHLLSIETDLGRTFILHFKEPKEKT